MLPSRLLVTVHNAALGSGTARLNEQLQVLIDIAHELFVSHLIGDVGLSHVSGRVSVAGAGTYTIEGGDEHHWLVQPQCGHNVLLHPVWVSIVICI